MRFTLDTHTHTIASGHAYNTIDEMAVYAAGHGVTHLAITDHAPKMPGSAGVLYFSNIVILSLFVLSLSFNCFTMSSASSNLDT